MRLLKPVLLLLFVVPLIAACRTGGPFPMPRGYVSYDKEYKSAPGPEAPAIGYEYSNENNATVIEDMRYAARDLVEALDQKLSFSVDEIYLKMPGHSAFYSSFDHLLRDELTQQGYLLANHPGNAVTIDFVVKEGVDCNSEENKSVYQRVYLALAIDVVEGTPKDFVGGIYEVPLYGFTSSDTVKVSTPLCITDAAQQLHDDE